MKEKFYAMILALLGILRTLIGFVLLNPIATLCAIIDRATAAVMVKTGEYDREDTEDLLREVSEALKSNYDYFTGID